MLCTIFASLVGQKPAPIRVAPGFKGHVLSLESSDGSDVRIVLGDASLRALAAAIESYMQTLPTRRPS